MAELVFTCRVESAGTAENRETLINLTDTGGEFSSRWFTALDSVKREMLATALAAIGTGFTVTVVLFDKTDEYTPIMRLYLRTT